MVKMAGAANFSVSGTFIHTPVYGQVEVLLAHCMIVGGTSGKILYLGLADSAHDQLTRFNVALTQQTALKEDEFLIPGFVDIHVHAPQYRYTGTGTDRPLMEWLDTYAFPAERSLADPVLAKDVYSKAVSRLLAHGTTTAMYFGTLHLSSCEALVDVLLEKGQRAVVGKVSMDRLSPADYVESTEDGLKNAKLFIEHVKERDPTGLVLPCITPRFIPTCSPALLQGLGDLATSLDVHVQSHISESAGEVDLVHTLHTEATTEAQIYKQAGLLGRKTVMAHGTMLTDAELQCLAASGTAIAHCALSNLYFGDKLFRVAHARSLGVKVGLGTDIAGGYSPSMLSAMRMTVLTGQMLRSHDIMNGAAVGDPLEYEERVRFKEAFYLATMGGAEALDMQDQIGTLKVGKELDALLVDVSKTAVFDIFPSDTLLDKFEKFINLGDDRNITKVWVRGSLVRSQG